MRIIVATLFDKQRALSVLPCAYRGVHLTISSLNDNINVWQDESGRTIRVKQPGSVWQLIGAPLHSKTIGIICKTTYYTDYRLKEETRQRTETCTNTFTHTEAKTHMGLSVRSNLLLTPGVWVLNSSSWQTKDPPEENNNHTATEEAAW